MDPQSEPKNQPEFRDFQEVYPISKTLMYSYEVQNVGRFIFGLPYKYKMILMLKGVGKLSHRNPKQNSREFLQRVRL